ncbi:hypothetical protein D8674_012910 [Pyrus ussuriensis x Pyrus communis]|uniref:DUF8040 domain-containing protein n=1 Tax=Pyrus ussuriensis x Pyrus communis TaxID=2448454 RepID=A0A5N5GT09_9ROSA|nr:hypothetical protein D8674_012910 [Pyrus ussuriensis x Pyrus communis]
MDSNEVDNTGSSSESDSSSDLDDSLGELLLVTRLYDHYSRLNKEPCMTSHFPGRQYVIELLNGHPHRLFDIVRMDKNTIKNLCSTLRELNFLQDDRSICVEDAVCMVIAETFQHSKEIVSRQFNRVLKEKYYVVDFGYANMSEFLAPYRKVRYHLRDFRGRGKRPRGAMELFNFRHSSLRNVVERCIGVLKNRFPILKCIPIACCAVHNFIRIQSRNDTLFQQFEDNDVDVVDEESLGTNQEGENMHLNDDNVMNDVGDHIAGSMWLDYINNN